MKRVLAISLSLWQWTVAHFVQVYKAGWIDAAHSDVHSSGSGWLTGNFQCTAFQGLVHDALLFGDAPTTVFLEFNKISKTKQNKTSLKFFEHSTRMLVTYMHFLLQVVSTCSFYLRNNSSINFSYVGLGVSSFSCRPTYFTVSFFCCKSTLFTICHLEQRFFVH